MVFAKKEKSIMKKVKIFGVSNNTAGQNLMRAVEKSEQPIGIPPYRQEEMLEIMRAALTSDEFDLLCRGYGINYPKRSQKEIAKELGMEETEVSKMANGAIRKLQGSPYKVMLEGLVPEVTEIFDLISRLQAEASDAKKLKKMEGRLRTAEAKLKESEKAKMLLKAEFDSLLTENEWQKKKLEEAEAEIGQARAATSAAVKASCEAVKSLEGAFHSSVEQTLKTLAGLAVSVGAMPVEKLNLSSEALKALENIYVRDTGMLCRMDIRALTSLVGKKHASEIRGKLQEVGLNLRAG